MAGYRRPVRWKSLWQLGSTLALYVGVCVAMYLSLELSYVLTLVIAALGAGLTVRLFIIQHDCGHGSFFRSAWANRAVGTLCGLLTLTPHAHWRRQHAAHHAVWNNLDKRASGADIYSSCLTVAEYRALSPFRRALHRFVQHPAVALVLLPPMIFLVLYRLPFDTPPEWTQERLAVHFTNVALVAILGALGAFVGYAAMLKVQLPIMAVASVIGVWLFSLQHRFDGVRWARQGQWSVEEASLRGSSYLRLPGVLRWFTGNIGYHHIHHLDAHIPNYRLRACHEALPTGMAPRAMSMWMGLRAFRYALWDEDSGRMITFKAARQRV